MVSASARAYESHAREFLNVRDRSTIGIGVVESWARSLPAGSNVLEIACGGGIPITRTLAAAGLNLWAIDASPTLISEFQIRFPDIPVKCADAIESDYFGRKFAAVISIELLFLLSKNDQIALIHQVSKCLSSGGRFLFTASIEMGTWIDMNTGHECYSLGRQQYETILRSAHFHVSNTYIDAGHNHYYEVERV